MQRGRTGQTRWTLAPLWLQRHCCHQHLKSSQPVLTKVLAQRQVLPIYSFLTFLHKMKHKTLTVRPIRSKWRQLVGQWSLEHMKSRTACGCTNPPGHIKTLKIILDHNSHFVQAPTRPMNFTHWFHSTAQQVLFELVSLSQVINCVLKAPSDSLPPLGNLFQ